MNGAPPMSPEQAAQLLARAERMFGGDEISSAIPRRKAIIFTDVASAKAHGAAVDEVKAQRAVDALRRIRTRGGIPRVEDLPAKDEVLALEICIRFMRPALLVQGGRVKLDPQIAWTASQTIAIEEALPAIGSIGIPDSSDPLSAPPRIGIATCFAIGRRAVVTNVHVVEEIARKRCRLDEALVRFEVEWDTAERSAPVRILGELGRCHGKDVVILETETDCPLAGLSVAETTNVVPLQTIVAVGHPLRDDARNPAWSQLMFNGAFGVKRVSPGTILGVDGETVLHDASTLGGNSGSPLLDLDTGRVVAVHSLGQFALKNEAVGTGAIRSEPELRARVERWV